MYVGHLGFSWSSTTSDTYSMFLDFDTQRLNPSTAYHRAHGLPLRCLSE
ncbi:hypothetical protein [uncultured Rikenella sp.]|nr:hypothetical protein [uncultured Rikenella sp.]